MAKSQIDECPAIGIDLGTTFSCVSVYRRGRAELIVDNSGDRLIPSIVYYDPDSENVLVGKEAYDTGPRCFGNCISDAKRIIGRLFEDQFVKQYIERKDVEFKIVCGENDRAVYEVEINNEYIQKTPEEVSGEILKYLKKMAENYLNSEISKVIISIPAYFSNAQRKATKKAAELAGLDLIKFITEPSAAGCHYIEDRIKTKKLMIFDWGGGTLDVSFLEVHNQMFEVKAVYGDTQLGGRDIDDILFKYFYRPEFDKICKRRLLNKCIDLKKKLSVSQVYFKSLDRFGGKNDFELILTRTQYEELAKDIFERAINVVDYGIHDVGWKISDVDEVVLVGGSTRIPKIRELLKTYFCKNQLKTDLNPDEAVAAGASLQAFSLRDYNEYIEKYKITEVTPLSLGLKDNVNLMDIFITRNSHLPIKRTLTRVTVINNQENACFEIFEGERKNCALNNKLGEFTISGLPPKRAGDVKFDVTFHLDEDGLLTVTATERSTKKTDKLIVTLGEFRLSEHRVKMSIAESKKLKYEDDVFEEFAKYKKRVQKSCLHIKYDIEKIVDEAERKIVESSCKTFLDDYKTFAFTEIDQLEARYKAFNSDVSSILIKYNLLSITLD